MNRRKFSILNWAMAEKVTTKPFYLFYPLFLNGYMSLPIKALTVRSWDGKYGKKAHFQLSLGDNTELNHSGERQSPLSTNSDGLLSKPLPRRTSSESSWSDRKETLSTTNNTGTWG
jgi:hypothetical protein